jgi:hypothetical protein
MCDGKSDQVKLSRTIRLPAELRARLALLNIQLEREYSDNHTTVELIRVLPHWPRKTRIATLLRHRKAKGWTFPGVYPHGIPKLADAISYALDRALEQGDL